MRNVAIFSLVAVGVLLSGCAAKLPKLDATLPTVTQQGAIEPPAPGVRGNWEFNATSNIAGNPPLRFAGGVESQTDVNKPSSDFSGALHIDGSTCFDRVMTATFTGNATADGGSVTITSSDGQMVKFTGVFAAKSPTGNYTNMTFTGTYSVSGGCASGDQGKVIGINIPSVYVDYFPWFGMFTSSAHNTFNLATPEGGDGLEITSVTFTNGVWEINGDIATGSPCFSKGTLRAGAFPSGSFILGKSVVLGAGASDSVLMIDGTLSDDGGMINGNYTISGGSCNDSGTVVIEVDPW